MQVRRIDPLTDSRWQRFVDQREGASIFHTRAWLEALRRTYRYEPIAYVHEDDNREIVSGIPFCAVRSLVTGRRLVSLPFSDHCEPLVQNEAQLQELLTTAASEAKKLGFRYIESRPLFAGVPSLEAAGLTESEELVIHRLDLSRSESEILSGFHKSCVIRKIKSDPEGLTYEEGRSERLLDSFYRLLVLTRRKHQIPPQPMSWFRNLIDCVGEDLSFRVAFHAGVPIASVLMLRFKNVVTYKYSCSDPEFNSLAGTTRLIWRIIQDAIRSGAKELDLGKSDLTTPGLIRFKDNWGAAQYPLKYYRCPAPPKTRSDSALQAAAKRVLTAIPDSVFTAVGGLLYRHVG